MSFEFCEIFVFIAFESAFAFTHLCIKGHVVLGHPSLNQPEPGSLLATWVRQARSWLSISGRGALLKECIRGAGMILTRHPPPSRKKIFPTSTLQLLSRYFISIFHTKFRYLAPPPAKRLQGLSPPV